MKKIKTILLLILFLVVLHSISAEAILGPAMGMMNTHPMAPQKGSVYTDIINGNTSGDTGRFDKLGIAIATSEKYPYEGEYHSWRGWEVTSKSFEKERFELLIDVDELMFVSDDNPVYKRPFELYALQRGVEKDDGAYKLDWLEYVVDEERTANKEWDARQEIRSIEELESGKAKSFPEKDTYRWVWRDVLLQLPGEPVSGGVEVENVFYPLIQGTYSARFTVEFRDIITGETAYLPVVIPGYYDASTSETKESSVAFTVNPDPSAVNLNIEQLVRNKNLQKVGSLDFIWRDGSDNITSPELDDGVKSYIFLSASSDPFNPEPDGFKLVHEDFVEGETAYSDINSIDYYVVLSGNSEHAGLGETFYGEDCFPIGAKEATKWVKTQCHKQLQPQQTSYVHYHTYTGDISIRVEGNPDVTMLAKGQYSSTIYVHVVAEDIQ